MDLIAPASYITCRRDRIYAAFKRARMTQEALAKKVGANKQVINDVLNGRRPGRTITQSLCAALGIKSEWVDHGTSAPEWIGEDCDQDEVLVPSQEGSHEAWWEFARTCLRESAERWTFVEPPVPGQLKNAAFLRAVWEDLKSPTDTLQTDCLAEIRHLMEKTGIMVKDFGPRFLQCFMYRGFSPSDDRPKTVAEPHVDDLDYATHLIRHIVGQHFDSQGKQLHPGARFAKRYQPWRRFALTAIPGAYEYASHIAITISGTPTVGLTIVPLTHAYEAFDLNAHRPHSKANVEALRDFIRRITGKADLGTIPFDFRWEMGFEEFYRSKGRPLPSYHQNANQSTEPTSE